MDLTAVNIFCFTASYLVALGLEAGSLVKRFGWHRVVLLGFATAGVLAHGIYLTAQAQEPLAPQAAFLSSPAEWYLIAAFALAVIYLAASFWWPQWATGIFLLPIVLGLIALASFAGSEPFAVERASLFWGQVHGWALVLGTVTVCVGFLAGLMYLIQSWRLKHKLPPSRTFRLPSLELLERINGRALGISALLVAGGFVSGLVLTKLKQTNQSTSLWTDPVVISLGVMLLWLIAAEAFRLLYPAASRGRKVAYLTLASFGFLVITLVAMTLVNRVHEGVSDNNSSERVSMQKTKRVENVPCSAPWVA